MPFRFMIKIILSYNITKTYIIISILRLFKFVRYYAISRDLLWKLSKYSYAYNHSFCFNYRNFVNYLQEQKNRLAKFYRCFIIVNRYNSTCSRILRKIYMLFNRFWKVPSCNIILHRTINLYFNSNFINTSSK